MSEQQSDNKKIINDIIECIKNNQEEYLIDIIECIKNQEEYLTVTTQKKKEEIAAFTIQAIKMCKTKFDLKKQDLEEIIEKVVCEKLINMKNEIKNEILEENNEGRNIEILKEKSEFYNFVTKMCKFSAVQYINLYYLGSKNSENWKTKNEYWEQLKNNLTQNN